MSTPAPPPSPRRRWPLALAGLLAVTALASLLSRRPAAPTEMDLPEVTRAELRSEDGRLLRMDSLAPFSGWLVERHPNGSLRSRSRLSEGVLDGISEGWDVEGRLEIRETYFQGKVHGLRTRWHPHGTVLSQASFVSGRPEGVFRRWHPDGSLAEQIEFREGREDGISLALYPSGFLQAAARVSQGTLRERESWADGEKPASPELTAVAPVQP